MNEVSKEQLSALLDDELANDEARFLLRQVGRDPELARTWARYRLMGETLRREAGPPVSDVYLRVARVTGAAPRRHRWLRYGVGSGIAAGVALAALIWLQPPTAAPGPAMALQAADEGAREALVADVDATREASPGRAVPAPAPATPGPLWAGNGLLQVQRAAAVRGAPRSGPLAAAPRRTPPVWLHADPARAGASAPLYSFALDGEGGTAKPAARTQREMRQLQ